MSDSRDYGFCPRCGALMQNGVCRSCGYTDPSVSGGSSGGAANGAYGRESGQQPSQPRQPYAQSGPYMQGGPYPQGTPYVQAVERKKSHKGLIITLSVIGAVLLLTGLILAIVFFFSALGRIPEAADSGYNGGYHDYYDDYGDYDSGYYEPSEDDPYYREITDSTRTDLSYGISWIVDSITPDDTEDYCTYYSTYPVLEDDERDYSAVNSRIEAAALEYKESYKDYPGGCSSLGYVTYMDETRISIVFQHSLYEDNGTRPRISALTFDLETGEEMKPEQMTEISEELVMRFRAQNTVQNGAVEFVDNASDEELLALLSDPDAAVYFYSPVGLEAGFNYESDEYGSGWVSVTLKDQAL